MNALPPARIAPAAQNCALLLVDLQIGVVTESVEAIALRRKAGCRPAYLFQERYLTRSQKIMRCDRTTTGA